MKMVIYILLFESFVNSEEYQTRYNSVLPLRPFESFVNSEEYQTTPEFSKAEIAV